jgi:ascorbate-specific PTS system EIIC-type component UlaA
MTELSPSSDGLTKSVTPNIFPAVDSNLFFSFSLESNQKDFPGSLLAKIKIN